MAEHSYLVKVFKLIIFHFVLIFHRKFNFLQLNDKLDIDGGRNGSEVVDISDPL